MSEAPFLAMWHRQFAPLSAADFLSFVVLNHILILTLLLILSSPSLSVNYYFSIFELFPYDIHIYDHVTRFRKYPLSLFIFVIINRGYYMAARRYQISVRMLKTFFTSERSERVEYFFKTREEISYLRAAM